MVRRAPETIAVTQLDADFHANLKARGVAQLVERLVRDQEVARSNRVTPTRLALRQE